MRILLVENDELFGECIYCGLAHYNYDVVWVKDSLIAWSSLQAEHFDLVVLDSDLPNLSSEEFLKNMRSRSIVTPVIIMSNCNSVYDRVKGLNFGADGYIGKPFELEELCARIRAIQRRVSSRVEVASTIGDIFLDTVARQVFKFGKEIKLSCREFVLLQILMEKSGYMVPRERIVHRLYYENANINSNALEVHIHNLRKKLGHDTIATYHKEGYGFVKQHNDETS
jgi:two-component system response regulator QseB